MRLSWPLMANSLVVAKARHWSRIWASCCSSLKGMPAAWPPATTPPASRFQGVPLTSQTASAGSTKLSHSSSKASVRRRSRYWSRGSACGAAGWSSVGWSVWVMVDMGKLRGSKRSGFGIRDSGYCAARPWGKRVLRWFARCCKSFWGKGLHCAVLLTHWGHLCKMEKRAVAAFRKCRPAEELGSACVANDFPGVGEDGLCIIPDSSRQGCTRGL